MTTNAKPQAIYLKDYKEPNYWIPEIQLHFDLHDDLARVTSHMTIEKNSGPRASKSSTLILNGENIKFVRLLVNNESWPENKYRVQPTTLQIDDLPHHCTLTIESETEPTKNLSCEGLYKSGEMFCTQCEAEGFRKITYFLDRPDVMSSYSVTIEADQKKYPVLLANGNLVEKRQLDNNRHLARWTDPFKKPCYLFALVAGNLGCLKDTFKTRSGKSVALELYCRKGLEDRCRHAMDSLKWAMKWDEDEYGLEYDLDVYMIVAADDFNMAAMENKGLNIFNSSYILANPETATDFDYEAITAVIGHEYFHNWTGNRVTCRDWFQLSLKEGLTVFRDQRFSADMTSVAVKRIEDVIRLRTLQFAEDAGPMSHPVRPSSFITIDNFYTMTIYEKGAELVRMIEKIVGRSGFRKGMDLYFKRHDGQAVTTEDFVSAMADANECNLEQFKHWYDRAGTPTVAAKTHYDSAKKEYTLSLTQHHPSLNGPEKNQPFHIPVAIGLIGQNGKDLPLQLQSHGTFSSGSGSATLSTNLVSEHAREHTLVLQLRDQEHSFTFEGVEEAPVLSLLRDFSAPVRLQYDYSDDELEFLIKNDQNMFMKWEATQSLTVRQIKASVESLLKKDVPPSASRLIHSLGSILDDQELDPAFTSYLLSLPEETYLAQFFNTFFVEEIHTARKQILVDFAHQFSDKIYSRYMDLSQHPSIGNLGQTGAGLRALRSQMLKYLCMNNNPSNQELALHHLREAKNMTDELGALTALNMVPSEIRELAFKEFMAKWKHEPLVINKWLSLQAVAPLEDSLENITRLANDKNIFDANNPNKVFALHVTYAKKNLVQFHKSDGLSYRYIADTLLDIDQRNPQVAARLVSAFSQWQSMDSIRQGKMKAELVRILEAKNLSANVYEVTTKILNS